VLVAMNDIYYGCGTNSPRLFPDRKPINKQLKAVAASYLVNDALYEQESNINRFSENRAVI